MQDQITDQKPFEFTGKHMALVMGFFFGVIIAVNVSMAVLAKSSWTGLVVKNSYVASQEFNRDLEAAKIQKASGIHSDVTYRNGKLSLSVRDKNGSLVKADNTILFVGRPAFEQADRTLELEAGETNRFEQALDLEEGPWAIEIRATVNGQTYRRDARLWVRSDGSARVE
ncbi:MAG: FixH family protein [Pseudomonadota bacterium]